VKTALLPVQIETARPARWVWVVLVLAFSHAVAIACFQILNVVVDPVKAAFALTDTQYSLMQGAAVAVFASLLGIPAAIVADRGNRQRVVLAGAVIWSGATMACGLAQSFGQLFMARMLIGVGEVFLFPAALSIIADRAPPKRLSSAIGIFGCGGPIGAAAALVGGGWLVGQHDGIGVAFPVSVDAPWRVAFLICSAFGAVAVGLLLTVAEPRPDRTGQQDRGSVGASLLRLRRHWGKAMIGVSGGMLALSFCVFATSSWSPTVLVRLYGMSYAQAGQITGLAALLGGVAGAWAAGAVTDKIGASGPRDAVLRVALVVAALILLTVVAAALSH